MRIYNATFNNSTNTVLLSMDRDNMNYIILAKAKITDETLSYGRP